MQQLQEAVAGVARDQTQTKALLGDVHVGQKLLEIGHQITRSNSLNEDDSRKLQQLLQTTHEILRAGHAASYSALNPSSPGFFLARARTMSVNNRSLSAFVDAAQLVLSAASSSPRPASRPASPFELQHSFLPETYTVADVIPASFACSSYQETAFSFTWVNRYELFYAKRPRCWVRLSLSITLRSIPGTGASRNWHLAER